MEKIFYYVFTLLLALSTTAASCSIFSPKNNYFGSYGYIIYGEKEFSEINCSALNNLCDNEIETFTVNKSVNGSLSFSAAPVDDFFHKTWFKVENTNYDDTLYVGVFILLRKYDIEDSYSGVYDNRLVYYFDFPASYSQAQKDTIITLINSGDKYICNYVEGDRKKLIDFLKDASNLNNKWIKKMMPEDSVLYLGND